jgi:hypothetical protein
MYSLRYGWRNFWMDWKGRHMTRKEELLALVDALDAQRLGATTGLWSEIAKAAAALREYAATMEQEPVAVEYVDGVKPIWETVSEIGSSAPWPEPMPAEETDDEFAAQIAKMDAKPAPTREPLTDDEVGQLAMQIYGMRDWTSIDIRFARAVLAAQALKDSGQSAVA